MTKITFFKKNNLILGFEVAGHTGKDEEGKDLLCCQISTVSQMAVLAVTQVAGINAFSEISDGYLKLMLTEKQASAQKIQFLLETCYESLKSIIYDNKRFAKMEVKNV